MSAQGNRLRGAAPLIVFALVSAACGPDEQVDPVDAGSTPSTTTSTGSAGTGGGGSGTGGGDPSPAVRSVFVRNPVGTPFDNLFADGDFELSIVPEQSSGGQWGWRAFSQTGGEAALLGETGGLCRTGLRCARYGGKKIAFGQGTAAPDFAPHEAKLWVKAVDPATVDAEKPCELIAQAVVVECDNFGVVSSLRPADAPAKDGWCLYSDELRGSRDALCLYVETDTREVLLDSATLLPAPNAVAPRSAPIVDAATRARLATIRAALRSRMPVSLGDPSPRPGALPSRERGSGIAP